MYSIALSFLAFIITYASIWLISRIFGVISKSLWVILLIVSVWIIVSVLVTLFSQDFAGTLLAGLIFLGFIALLRTPQILKLRQIIKRSLANAMLALGIVVEHPYPNSSSSVQDNPAIEIQDFRKEEQIQEIKLEVEVPAYVQINKPFHIILLVRQQRNVGYKSLPENKPIQIKYHTEIQATNSSVENGKRVFVLTTDEESKVLSFQITSQKIGNENVEIGIYRDGDGKKILGATERVMVQDEETIVRAIDKRRQKLYEILKTKFSMDELDELCFLLGEYSLCDQTNKTHSGKVINIISHFANRDRLEELYFAVRNQRPNSGI